MGVETVPAYVLEFLWRETGMHKKKSWLACGGTPPGRVVRGARKGRRSCHHGLVPLRPYSQVNVLQLKVERMEGHPAVVGPQASGVTRLGHHVVVVDAIVECLQAISSSDLIFVRSVGCCKK